MSDVHFVVIHGLASKPAENVLYERFRKYLGEAAGRDVPEERLHLAYWADLMGYEPPDGPDRDEYVEGGDNFKPYSRLERLRLSLRGLARNKLVELTESGLRETLRPGGDEALGTRNLLSRLPDFLAGGPARKVYEHLGPDLNRYFFGGYRERVLDRLRAELDAVPAGARLCLIAHSMGSIIAADLLLRDERHVDTFITIGSPLGLLVIQEQLDVTPARLEQMREKIGEWFNLYDRMDVVALDSDLADDYAPIDIDDVRIRNEFVNKDGERNHHKSYGYLRCPQMGEIIA